VVALFGVSFLTPLDALFALAAAVPLAALLAAERRARWVGRLLALSVPGRRAVLPSAVALVLLPALVGVAAAQPVVVHETRVSERGDAQAWIVFDTSLSMDASAGPGRPTRLARAKRLAVELRAALPDVPTGIAAMTDRTLPVLMPTTDAALFARTIDQSVQIDSPPPSQVYRGRATSFMALAPLVASNFFAHRATRRVLVVFTDGESSHIPTPVELTLRPNLTALFVHVWSPGERLYDRDGGRRTDPGYHSDPTSGAALENVAGIAGGRAFSETQITAVASAARAAVGYSKTEAHVDAYARLALAPWFVLGGVLPLGFLLYRRNL